MSEEKMITVWEWVGLVLMSYGIILLAAGTYLLFHPHKTTELWYLHPNLWWGAVMLLCGVVMFFLPRKWKSGWEDS